jgi:hypothetical protein
MGILDRPFCDRCGGRRIKVELTRDEGFDSRTGKRKTASKSRMACPKPACDRYEYDREFEHPDRYDD